MTQYKLAPLAFGCFFRDDDPAKTWQRRRQCIELTWRIVAFVAVSVVFVAWAWARSPSVSSSTPFDLLEEITRPWYEWARAHEFAMRHFSNFVIYCLYLIVTCFLFQYMRRDFWVLLQLGVAFLLSLLASTIIGMPLSPEAINYWKHGFFPLESLISDNIVCFHLVISWVCSHTIMLSAEQLLVSFVLVLYNVILCLFLVATRNTSSVAIMIAMACAFAAEKSRLQSEYLWSIFTNRLYVCYRLVRQKCGCGGSEDSDIETEKLTSSQRTAMSEHYNTNGDSHIVIGSDGEEEEEQPVQSTSLFEAARAQPPEEEEPENGRREVAADL